MQKPIVSIIMGSDSDLNVMKEAAILLDDFNIEYEINVISAHRSPKKAYEFAQNLVNKGIKVIIAGAGGAAHLPGIIAALTPLPVIGVPIYSASLNGIDSLLSIVQMPSGIPVATVGINAAKNAAILAAQILATSDENIMLKVIEYKADLEKKIEEKNKIFLSNNWKNK
ncbi:MAG: 5-(carboxyamino)imidazole ribonucleotide mutase [Exilispira sp.]